MSFSKISIERLSHVHPDLQRLMLAALPGAPFTFEISQGLRTEAEQAELYAQGRTKPGKVVTWTMQSRHLTGHAVDVVIIIGGKAIWTPKLYDQLAVHIRAIAKELRIDITWGGTFKNKLGLPRPDRPHFELSKAKYP